MLTTEDKKYLHNTFATKKDLEQYATKNDLATLRTDMNNDFEDRMARQLGAHLEAIDAKFQMFAEMIMAHIDKKFEQFQNHEVRLTKIEQQTSFNKTDIGLHERRLKLLEG